MYSAVVNYTMKRTVRCTKEGGVRITHLCMEQNPERNEKHIRDNCVCLLHEWLSFGEAALDRGGPLTVIESASYKYLWAQ